jgi:opacity protein-like surface antigen
MKKVLCILLCSLPLMAWADSDITGMSLYLGSVSPRDAALQQTGQPDTTLASSTGKMVGLGFEKTLEEGWNPIADSMRQDIWRLETAVDYRETDNDKLSASGTTTPATGKIKVWDLMANLYLDFQIGHHVHPYLGAGVGGANLDASINGDSGHDNVFAYQGIAGIGVDLGSEVILGVQYRYFATLNPQIEAIEAEYKTDNLLLSLRHRF